jgi:hypothetical protein
MIRKGCIPGTLPQKSEVALEQRLCGTGNPAHKFSLRYVTFGLSFRFNFWHRTPSGMLIDASLIITRGQAIFFGWKIFLDNVFLTA